MIRLFLYIFFLYNFYIVVEIDETTKLWYTEIIENEKKGGVSMTITLLLAAIVMLICLLCNVLSSKFGIPMLLAFIVLGMVFGSDGIFKIAFDNFEFAEQFSTVALIFIIFYGGFGTNWREAKKVALPSLVLSSLGVLLTAALTAIFCHYILSFSWLEGLLIGAVLSSTDAASVFALLRNKHLNLKYGTASMLELESGSNDPWAYMMTALLLTIATSKLTAANLFVTVFSQIVFGLMFGGIIFYGAIWIMKHIHFDNEGFDAIFIVAVVLISYAAPTAIGGNGYLSAYLVGILLGNQKLMHKKVLVHFFDGIVGLMQIAIFFLLGLLSFPSQMMDILIPAIFIFLFLTFLARPLIMYVLLSLFHAPSAQKMMVSWAGLRGATSIVFAIMVQVSDVNTRNDIFHIAFCIVLFSIALQGTLLPFVAKKLHMIDHHENVMKTFSDYSEESDVSFLRVQVKEEHPWVNQKIQDISFPPDVRIAVFFRQGTKMIPKGDSVILANDNLILSTTQVMKEETVPLYEVHLHPQHKWIQKAISELPLPISTIILVKRNGEVLLPYGDLCLLEQDIVVLLDDVI